MRASRLVYPLIALLALSRPASVISQGSWATDSAAIIRLIRGHAEAWNRRDARAAAGAYAPAADIRYSSGQRLQGRAAVEASARPRARGGRGPVRLPGGSTGAVPPPERSLLFLVLIKERGRWSVLAQRNPGLLC